MTAAPTYRDPNGHPANPLTAVRTAVAEAPPGYLWEFIRRVNDQGHDILAVNLVKIATNETVATHECNLSMYRVKEQYHYDETWIDRYGTFSENTKKNLFQKDLVNPFKAWSYTTANKIAHEGDTTEYKMG